MSDFNYDVNLLNFVAESGDSSFEEMSLNGEYSSCGGCSSYYNAG